MIVRQSMQNPIDSFKIMMENKLNIQKFLSEENLSAYNFQLVKIIVKYIESAVYYNRIPQIKIPHQFFTAALRNAIEHNEVKYLATLLWTEENQIGTTANYSPLTQGDSHFNSIFGSQQAKPCSLFGQ